MDTTTRARDWPVGISIPRVVDPNTADTAVAVPGVIENATNALPLVGRDALVRASEVDVGWAVGHSYAVYAPLLAGCTLSLTCLAGEGQKWEQVPAPVRETILANGGTAEGRVDKERGKIGGKIVYEAEP